MTSDCGERSWLDTVILEPMRPSDLAAVLRIERASFPSAWTPESYLRELRNLTAYYLVARREGELLGYAGMWVTAAEAHVSTLAVRPDLRRRGLGERMMRRLMEIARAREATYMTLEVRQQNDIALALYRKLGFKIGGLLPQYYGDTGENAYTMSRELADDEPRSP